MWQGYYSRVLSWCSLNITVFWFFKKIAVFRKVKFGRNCVSNIVTITLVTQGLTSSSPLADSFCRITCSARRGDVLTYDTLPTCFGKRRKRLGKHIIHRFTLNKITHVINEIFAEWLIQEQERIKLLPLVTTWQEECLGGNCVNKIANFLFVMKTWRKRCWFNSVTAKQWNNKKKLTTLKDGNSLLFLH